MFYCSVLSKCFSSKSALQMTNPALAAACLGVPVCRDQCLGPPARCTAVTPSCSSCSLHDGSEPGWPGRGSCWSPAEWREPETASADPAHPLPPSVPLAWSSQRAGGTAALTDAQIPIRDSVSKPLHTSGARSLLQECLKGKSLSPNSPFLFWGARKVRAHSFVFRAPALCAGTFMWWQGSNQGHVMQGKCLHPYSISPTPKFFHCRVGVWATCVCRVFLFLLLFFVGYF